MQREPGRNQSAAPARSFRAGSAFQLIVLACVALYVGLAFPGWKSNQAADYFQFWVVGQAISQKISTNVYAEADRQVIKHAFIQRAKAEGSEHERYCAALRPTLELAGTPFLYTVFHLTSSGAYDKDYSRFRVVSLIVFIAGVVALGRLLGFPPWASAAALVLLTCFPGPFAEDVHWGNVSGLQLGALGVFLLLRKYLHGSWLALHGSWLAWISGLGLGFLVMFKPTLVYLVLLHAYWEIRCGHRETLAQHAGGFAIAVVASVASSWMVLGPACGWIEWAASLKSTLLTEKYIRSSFLAMVFGWEDLRLFAILGGLLSMLTIACLEKRRATWIAEQQPAWMMDFYLVSFGMMIYILSSPVVHPHYLLLLTPAFLFAMCPIHPSSQRRWPAIISAVLILYYPALLIFPFVTFINCRVGAYAGVILLFAVTCRNLLAQPSTAIPAARRP